MPAPFQDVQLPKEDQLLVSLYSDGGRTLDDLPYTDEFERLYAQYVRSHQGKSKQDVFQRLFNLRKAGRLPRLGASQTASVPIQLSEAEALTDLVARHAGSLGRRDRLVYAPEFDALANEFNAIRRGEPLDRHAIWRLIARVAK